MQQFQESFTKSPKDIPIPEPPEWGHLDKEAKKRDDEMSLARARQKRIDRRIADRLKKYGTLHPDM